MFCIVRCQSTLYMTCIPLVFGLSIERGGVLDVLLRLSVPRKPKNLLNIIQYNILFYVSCVCHHHLILSATIKILRCFAFFASGIDRAWFFPTNGPMFQQSLSHDSTETILLQKMNFKSYMVFKKIG